MMKYNAGIATIYCVSCGKQFESPVEINSLHVKCDNCTELMPDQILPIHHSTGYATFRDKLPRLPLVRNMTATEVLKHREGMMPHDQLTKSLCLYIAEAAERAAIKLTMDSISRTTAYGLQTLAEELLREADNTDTRPATRKNHDQANSRAS